MVQDTSLIKEKIVSIFERRGPLLPVHIAKEIGLSILFTSAFLSELLSENKIKMSNMRVGNSPIYFISNQENMLENFSEHLKSKEKEAFLLIKEKKFLKDSEQEPAIRVALRAIKDFAIPFRENEEIYWRYFNVLEIDFEESKIKKTEKASKLNLEEKEKIKPKKKIIRKQISQKKNERFFEKIKKFLSEKSIEILEIEGFSKNDIILRIKENGSEKLLIAYNKKRITETDLIKAHKKSLNLNLQYVILSLGDLPKKLEEFLKAIKNLSRIEKIV